MEACFRDRILKKSDFLSHYSFSFPTILSSSHNSDSSNYEIKRKAKYKLTICREKNKYVQYMNTEF